MYHEQILCEYHYVYCVIVISWMIRNHKYGMWIHRPICSSNRACHMAFCVSAVAAMDSTSIVDRATDVYIRLCQDSGSHEIMKRM